MEMKACRGVPRGQPLLCPHHPPPSAAQDRMAGPGRRGFKNSGHQHPLRERGRACSASPRCVSSSGGLCNTSTAFSLLPSCCPPRISASLESSVFEMMELVYVTPRLFLTPLRVVLLALCRTRQRFCLLPQCPAFHLLYLGFSSVLVLLWRLLPSPKILPGAGGPRRCKQQREPQRGRW